MGQVEHEQLDFKRGVPDDIRDTIPAMAMTDGGIIVHGVNSDLELVGCPLSQNTADRITRYARECGVEVQVRSVLVDQTELTIVGVPEVRERIVTTPDGRLLRRVGGDCQRLIGDALGRFVRTREERPGDEEPLPTFDPADIELSALNAALQADGRPSVPRRSVVRRARPRPDRRVARHQARASADHEPAVHSQSLDDHLSVVGGKGGEVSGISGEDDGTTGLDGRGDHDRVDRRR